MITLGGDEIRGLPVHSQFMLMNTTKEPTDDYVLFKGVRIIDVLSAAKVYLTGVTGITVFAPDGYSIDYSLEDIQAPFPHGIFYAEPGAFEGTEKAFVKYPPGLPAGVTDRKTIPAEPWLLLAYERNGTALDPSSYEKGTGRLAGEGPYRLIKPQRDLSADPQRPGRPDRSQKSKVFGDGWDYVPGMDHNAGACVRGACVIRVNPMPDGMKNTTGRTAGRSSGIRRSSYLAAASAKRRGGEGSAGARWRLSPDLPNRPARPANG